MLEEHSTKEEGPNDDEFDINLLNSEYDQPAPVQKSVAKPIKVKLKPQEDYQEAIKKLKEELSQKDLKIQEYEQKMISSPKATKQNDSMSDCSSNSKEYKIMKERMLHAEDELNKKTAVFKRESDYLSKKVEEANKTIEKLKASLQEQKENYNQMLDENEAEFDRNINALKSKLEETKDKIIDLEGALLIKDREIEKEADLRRKDANNHEMELKKQSSKIQELEYRIEKLTSIKYVPFPLTPSPSSHQLEKNDSLKSEETLTSQRKQIQSLESDIRNLQKSHEESYKKLNNSNALLVQQVTFLEQEKAELQQKLIQRATSDENIMNMIQKRCEEECKEIKEEHEGVLKEKEDIITQLQLRIQGLKEYYEEEIKSSKEGSEEVVSEFTERLKGFEKVVAEKEEKVRELEEVVKKMEVQREEMVSEIAAENGRLKARVLQLEEELGAVDKSRKSQTFKMNSEAEERIKQIKDVYEAERKKFQNTLSRIRRDNEEEIKGLQEEYENKLNQSSSHHEEEISYIQGQLNQVREERQRAVGKS